MKFRYLFFLFTTYFVNIGFINGQVLNPVSWEFKQEKIEGDRYKLIFTASIEDGWTVYSQYTDDNGPVPTEIVFEEKEGLELIGKSVEKGKKKEGLDRLFGVNVIKFLSSEPFIIEQEVRLLNSSGSISGYLTFMSCDNERCLPPTDVDFSFELPPNKKKEENEVDNTVASGDNSLSTINPIDEPNTSESKANTVQDKKSKTAKSSASITEIGKTQEVQSKNIIIENEVPDEISLDIDNTSIDTPDGDLGIYDPVNWEISYSETGEDKYRLTFTATLDNGWYIYSQESGEDGPIPTTIVYEKMDGYSFPTASQENGDRKEGYEKLFDANVIKYSSKEPFIITQDIEADESASTLSGYIEYMACNDVRCTVPLEKEFSLNLTGKEVALTENLIENQIEGEFIDQRIASLYETYKDPISDCGDEEVKSSSAIWTFLFGFIGGLLALLTPCVFPMIPITVSFFTKDTKRSGLTNGLIYGASIIVIYVLLGLLVTIVMGPEALNRLSTNYIANTIFFLIFLAFAFSFFGFYEITLPSSWTTGSDRMADKGGLIGIFFMAFTLALVSFSCTGPIIGTALVQAASKGEYIGPFLVMFGFSSALALPFGLFAAFPVWLNSLPKSGGWMNTVKVVLGFLELALAFKFLSVADMTNHWGFLRYELFMGIWILTFIGLALYLFGFIKFPHDSPLQKISNPRKVLGFAVIGLCVYLATGFTVNKETGTYNTVGLLSGIAPPAQYNFFLPAEEADATLQDRFISYTKCANNIDCFKDYYEALAYAKESNKPLLLDMTGYGCFNCRKTEEHIWVDPEIRRKLNDEFVLASLYGDDDTKLPTTYKSKRQDGKKLRNVGNMWADFAIANFETNSQPLYIMVTPDERIIGNPRGFKEGIKGYNEYLECGLDAYAKLQ